MEQDMIIKKDNKKAKKTFIIFIIAGALVGFFSGMFLGTGSYFVKNSKLDIGKLTVSYLGFASQYILIAIGIFTLVYSIVSFMSAKDYYEKIKDLEDEEYEKAYDKLDRKLEIQMAINTITFICSYGFFSAFFYYMVHGEDKRIFSMLLAVIAFVVNMFVYIAHQQKCVDLVRMMNPEKKGSVYDIKFKDKWIDSCDEAEKLIIYQCGFKAYKVTSGLCIGLWLFFTLLSELFAITLWPVFTVILIWLVLSITYMAEERKLRKVN